MTTDWQYQLWRRCKHSLKRIRGVAVTPVKHWLRKGGCVRRVVMANAAAAIALSAAHAQELPSVKLQTAPLVSSSNWWTLYSSATTHTVGIAAQPTAPEIIELAKALSANGAYTGAAYATLVYEYVRNNIAIEFRFGLGKGAFGALVDQSGTAFDQAALMVALLSQGNVAAQYQAGTISLTAAQFTAWTGLANAAAACQFLADGGIPATVNGSTNCAGLTGSLAASGTAVVMAHMWVSTTNYGLFDPAYKVNVAKTGIGMAALGTNMGCGSTCVSTITSYVPTPVNSSISGVKSVVGVNQTAMENTLTGYATTLQRWIQTQNANNYATAIPNMLVEDLIGGPVIDITQPTTTGTLLTASAYTPTAALSWSSTAGIPDQYRTTFTVQYGAPGALAINQPLFADETGGRRIRIFQVAGGTATLATVTASLYSEDMLLAHGAVNNLTGSTPWIPLTLVVTHPYAPQSSAYLTETLTYNPVAYINGCGFLPNASCSQANWSANVLTIVQGWGDSTESTIYQNAAILQRDATHTPLQTISPQAPASLTASDNIYLGQDAKDLCGVLAPAFMPTGPSLDPGCRESHQATISAGWLAQASRAIKLAAGVNGAIAQLHHTLGVISSGPVLPGDLLISVQTSMSVNSQTAVAADRTSAFLASSAVLSRLEGAVIEQQGNTWEGGSAVSMMTKSNLQQIPFYDVPANTSAANLTTLFGNIANYGTYSQSDITSYSGAGYELILPQNGQVGQFCDAQNYCGGYAFNGLVGYLNSGTRVAFLSTAAGWDKGSGGVSDPTNLITQQTTIADYATKSRKHYAVDLTSGDLAFTPPADLVTGIGDFPYALSYQRVYSPSNVGFTCVLRNARCVRTDTEISGLPIGWTHSLAITARLSNDGLAAFGRSSALDASRAVAALYVARMLNLSTPTFQSRLATIFVTNWLGENLVGNVVAIRRPPENSAFVRLPDGSFNPEPGSAEILRQTGIRTFSGSDLNWNNAALSFSLVTKTDETLQFSYASPQVAGGIPSLYLAQSWSFPSGMAVNFTYAAAVGTGQDESQCLTGVSNNLGRSLTFNNTCTSPPTPAQTVTDDSTRQVQIGLLPAGLVGEGSGSLGWFGPQDLTAVAGLLVTSPDGVSTSEFDYVASPSTNINRNYYRIYDWITPLEQSTGATPSVTAGFDSLYRVSTMTDNALPTGYVTRYYLSGLYGSENQKRADVVDPLAAMTTTYADRWNHTLQGIDPLGRATSYTYDSARRLTKTTYPELNTDVFTFDIRSNPLSVTHNPVPGSTLAPTAATTTYEEGPTVMPCVSPATCNSPSSTTDANIHTTHYYYLTSGTGQLQRVVGPVVTAQTGGVSGQSQTDYCYASGGTGGAVSLLSGIITKVDSSTNRVLELLYNSSNDWTLSSSIVNPTPSLVPPTASGSACGTGTTTTPTPAALTTAYTFDAGTSGSGPGNVTAIKDPNSNTTSYTFDSMRRLTSVSAPLNAFTRYCYDADSELLSTNRARFATTGSDPNLGSETITGQCNSPFPVATWQSETRTYLPTGDVQSVADAAGNTTTYAYDADGRLQVLQDPVGRQSLTLYDIAGEVLARWRGGSGWIASTGIPSGTWPKTWAPTSYTGSGPLQYESYCYGSLPIEWQNCYSANGKPLYAVDADGHATEYQYDGLDRLRVTYFPDPALGTLCTPATNDGTSLPVCSGKQTYELLTYDAVGNTTSVTTRRGDLISHQFDAANHEILKSPAGQGAVSYGLNLLGEPYAIDKAANGSLPAHTTTYTYDGAGRKHTETNDGRAITYGYDGDGNRTSTTWPDGYYVSYTYDALKRMQFARENSTTTNELAYYTYDPLSRRNSLCLGAGTTSCQTATTWTNQVAYGYEAVDGQLDALTHTLNATVVSFSYARNAAYQIKTLTATDTTYLPAPASAVTTSYVPNGLNEYGSIANQTSIYDLNGNLQTWYPPGGEQTYDYDSENRLIDAGVAGSATRTIYYDYDGLGRRVSKTVNGVVTNYLLDGDEEIAEYSGNNVLRRYIAGPGVDDRIAHADGSAIAAPPKTYYHTNHQGSVMAMTDNAGNVMESMSYDEYGNGTPSTGEQFGYTGRRFDPETGLYYYRARYYVPQLGRFLQADPIGYKDDLNSYTYVGNDPLDKTDSTGKQEELEIPLVVEEVATMVEELEGGAVEGAEISGQATRSLRTNMANADRAVGEGEHGHHIVAQNAGKAAPARTAMEKAGISVENEANGARVAASDHAGMHTTSYYETVNSAIVNAAKEGANAILDTLRRLGNIIEGRGNPGPPTPPTPPTPPAPPTPPISH